METRNYLGGASASPPSAPASPSNGYPTGGNPSTGTSATQPGPHWFYKMGEELRAIIAGAGITPADTDLAQVAKAIQNGGLWSAAAGGAADAITASFNPAVTALKNGMTLSVRSSSANATPTPTFTPNSGVIGTAQIVKGAGSALIPEDIAGGGHWIDLQWDATLSKWVLLNPAFGASGTAGSMNTATIVTAASTRTAADFGSLIELGTSTITQPGYTTVIPNANLQQGAVLKFINNPFSGSTSNPVQTLSVSGCYFFGTGANNGTTMQIPVGGTVELISDGYNWLFFNGAGAASMAANGYQKLESGLILQWGVNTLATGNGDVVTLPVAFPNFILHINTSENGISCKSTSWQANGAALNSFKGFAMTPNTGAYFAGAVLSYLALGY